MHGELIPIQQKQQRVKALEISEETANLKTYCHLRRVRADKRFKGRREKKARETAEEGIGSSKR